MERTRYCRNHSYNEYRGKGMIENYLSEEIDYLLTPTTTQLLNTDISDIYISTQEIKVIEDDLKKYLEPSLSDKVLFLTGVTGCGKTMILRYVFEIRKQEIGIKNQNLR